MSGPSISSRLRKSATDRVIDGVCGGVASYLKIDVTLVRIGWVLSTLAGGVGIILYLAAMVIMPSPVPNENEPKQGSKAVTYLIAGVFLVACGLIWLLAVADILPFHSIARISWKALFPLLLVFAGLFLLFRRRNTPIAESREQEESSGGPSGLRKLYRSRVDKKLFGVCGGLGVHFGVDPVFVRILFVAFAIASFGLAIVAYLLLSILVPEEPITFAL